MQIEQSLAMPENSTPSLADPLAIETAESRRQRFRQGLVEKQRGKQARLKPMLLELRKHFRTRDADARRKHLQQIDIMFRYFDGDMYGGYDELGVYKDNRQAGDFAYSIPVLAGHVGEAFMQLMKVNPDYIITPHNNRDENMNRLARMCEELGNENLERLMQEDEHQTETLNAILAGDSYREIFWAVNPDAPKTTKRIRQVKAELEIPGRRECLNCKTEVAEGESECPSCGVSSIRDIPPGQGTRYDPEEYEVELGENCLRIPHPMGMQSDLSALKSEDSTHIIEHDYLEKQIASWFYQADIETSDLGMSAELTARHNLERSTVQMDAIVGSTRAQGRALVGRKVERERHFWDVSEYGWIYCEVEEPLPNPVPDPDDPSKMVKAIPANTLLGDFFRDGVHVDYIGETIIDIQPCRKRKRWLKIQYGKRPGSSVGMGAKLLAMLNDIVNDDYNLVHAIKHTSARPFTVVAGQSVKLLPEAGNILRIDRLPLGVRDIRGAIAQYPGQSVAGMDATSMQIQQAMQFIFGSYTLGAGGAPDMQAMGKTATEVTARVEQASGRQIGPIGQRIAADKETILICLENIQEYSTKEQKAELSKRFGTDIVDIYFKTNLRQVISVGIKPNSDIPRSLAMTQAGRLAFTQAAASLVPLAAQVPWVMEFLEDMADTYGFPLSVGKGRSDRRKAEERLNKLAAIEEHMIQKTPEVMNDPDRAATIMYAALVEFCGPLIAPEADEQVQPSAQAGAPDGQPAPPGMNGNPPVPPQGEQAAPVSGMSGAPQPDPFKDIARVFLQDHDTFMDAYKDEVFSEKAMTYSRPRILVILKLWEDHFFAQMKQVAEKAKMQQAVMNQIAPPQDDPEANKSPAQKIVESLQIKYTDLTATPNAVQAQVLQAAGIQVPQVAPDGQPDEQPDPAQAHALDVQKMALEHEAGEESKNADAQREMAVNEHSHGLSEKSKNNDLQRKIVEQTHHASTQMAVDKAKPEVRTQG